MKTQVAAINEFAQNGKSIGLFNAINKINITMKKLANTSPFLLLLIPVFILMIFAVAGNQGNKEVQEASLKNSRTSGSLIKAAAVILK